VARVSSQEVQQQLHTQLRTLLGQGDAADSTRLARLESQLKPLYSSMPKSADGGLEHGAVRYALHRFFAHQHGWHVRGLEATGTEKLSDAASSTSMLEDHIPSYVLQLFDQHHAGRTGLRELAVLAATLEDVVHSEAVQLVSTAYVAQGQSTAVKLTGDVEHRIVTTYLLFHLMPNPLYAQISPAGMNRILDQAPEFWTGWMDTVMWVQDMRDSMDFWEASARNPFAGKAARSRDFNSLVRWVERVGEDYGRYQDLECRGLKSALLDLSDGSGRVPLAKFYEAAFQNRSSHFNESPDYLRHLGVLDETDPRHPAVMITNYINGPANCLAASGLYSICCIDECEALMAQLERDIASPTAAPQRVVDLVAAMPSDTVSAPRNISAAMRQRLDEIAERHGGSVPLHGRLFAQWMHHAFPNECSFPHLSGSLESPVDPMSVALAEEEEGHKGFRLQASQEEMQAFMTEASSFNASHPVAPLLWTDEEELIVGALTAPSAGKARSWLRCATLALAISSVSLALIRMLGVVPASVSGAKAGEGRSLPKAWGTQRPDIACV